MKQKRVKSSIIQRSLITLISLLCLVTISASPVFALNLGDYFTIDYDIELSKTVIRGNETFYATVEGTATCNQDLPLTVSEGYVTSRIVAKHQESGDEVILNPSYTITINRFPNNAGDSTQASEVVSLTFPSGSQPGSYDVTAKITRARINTTLLGWLTVTSYLPSTQEIGSINYIATVVGGGGIIIEPDTDLSDYMDDSGALTEDFTFISEDGVCQLDIGEGTIAITKDEGQLDEITIDEMEDPPNPPQDSHIIGLTYRLGPKGASFDPPITITFTYDTSLIPKGVSEENLVLAMWDEDISEWVILEGFTVDADSNAISAPVNHFTPFAILSYIHPASFEVIGLTINPDEVSAGQTIAIIPLIANTGDLSSSYEITLKIDDVVVETKELTIAGGTEYRVAFIITRDTAGTYTIDVNGMSGTFEVTEPPPPTPAAFTTGALIITPDEVNVGEEVTISITVANTSELDGSYEATLKIDDAVVESKQVTVAGGGSEVVSFSISRDTPGVYWINIDGLSGTFEVKVAPKPTNWRLIVFITATAIAIVVPLLIRRRRMIA